MGLARDLMRGVSGQPAAISVFRSIAESMEVEQTQWISKLREAGVKAAHPDDGWVNRTHNTMQMVYPQFNDGAKVGDLIALGWPQWGSKRQQHRIVRLTRSEQRPFINEVWHFEQVAP